MKMNIEIDCTPEEARSFLGLPDVSKANEAYVNNVTDAMKSVTSLDQLDKLAKQVAPMGQMGLKLFQGLAEAALSSDKGNDKSDDKNSGKSKD